MDRLTSSFPHLTISFDCFGLKFLSLNVAVTVLAELK